MTRARRRLWIFALSAFLSTITIGVAPAAPPWLEGLRNYRIVDASGRIDYRPDPNATGRIAYRPTSAPSIFLRGRPFFASGYAGALYGPNARGAPLVPTGYWAGKPKSCGHVGACSCSQSR